MIQALFVFLLGLIVGSFLNAVAFRTHEGRSFLRGRSRCPVCEARLKPVDLIPVVSYVLLHGHCRHCAAAISPHYPFIEFAAGVLFLCAYLRYANGFSLPAFYLPSHAAAFLVRDLVFISFLLIIFLYDLRYAHILDRFSVPAMTIAFLFNAALGAPAWQMGLGALVLGGFFLVQFLFSRGVWVGGGDVRMGVVMGCMLGIQFGLVALFFAYAIGAFVGAFLLIKKKVGLRSELPFGTFLSAGTLIVLLAGERIVQWYVGLL